MSATSESSVAPLPPGPSILAAGTPFDKPSADTILRTADGVHFRVHSYILAVASPFFEIMFSLPQSHSSSTGDIQTTGNRPVIDVAEDSTTLDALLRICYPVPKQDIVYSLNRLEALWTAAVKYEMALPLEVLRKQLLDAADFSPVAAWGVASRVGLEILARRAAEKTLGTSLKVAENDLVGVTAADFYRLREFHRAEGRVPVDFRLLTPSKHTTSDGGAHTSVPSSEPFILKQDMPFADLICRSSDGVEFEVHRWVISTASAMLYQRITSIESANIHEKPVLKLDENSTVVSALLGLCYQPSGELPTNPTSLYSVLVAAQKYEMEGVMKAVQNRWANSRAQGVDALSFYLIAAHLRWKETAQVVAAYTLSDPLPRVEGQPQVSMPTTVTTAPLYSPFMESTPAVVYLRLIRYHEIYQRTMQGIFERSRCPLPLSKVLHKAILTPNDAILFTSHAVVESYQQGHTQGKKEYYTSSDDAERLRNALNEVAKLMKDLSIEV